MDLLISDVVLPDMRGPELVARLAAKGVSPRVLYTSGFTEQGCMDCVASGRYAFLSKPWTPRDLLDAARELLDAGASNAA